MKHSLFSSLIYVTLGVTSQSALAQNSPIGLWKTYSDADGALVSEIRIIETSGVLTGRIERVYGSRTRPDALCTECKDERKDHAIQGLTVIRGARRVPDKDVWEGGDIMDTRNGTVYELKMVPLDEGRRMEVRGFLGISLLGKSQIWVRSQ